MDGHLNKITNLVRPLLPRARRMDSQPLGHLDDSGPGLWGPVHSWVGDSSLRKGLLFTEHSRGKPCRIHKTGYNVKMILGIDGRYIFVALILMIKATDSRFFFFLPTWKRYALGHFFSFFQNWYVDIQTGLCTTGAVSQKGNRKDDKVLQHIQQWSIKSEVNRVKL